MERTNDFYRSILTFGVIWLLRQMTVSLAIASVAFAILAFISSVVLALLLIITSQVFEAANFLELLTIEFEVW